MVLWKSVLGRHLLLSVDSSLCGIVRCQRESLFSESVIGGMPTRVRGSQPIEELSRSIGESCRSAVRTSSACPAGAAFDPSETRILDLAPEFHLTGFWPVAVRFFDARGAALTRSISTSSELMSTTSTSMPPDLDMERMEEVKEAPGGTKSRTSCSRD